MTELLSCPFCGTHLSAYSEAVGYYHLGDNCKLAGFEFPADGYAEARWNTHASVVITDAMVEAGAVAAAKVIAARHGHEFEFWLNDERRAEARAVLSVAAFAEKEPNP